MRKRNEKGQFSKTKVSEFGFVNLSTYTSPEVKEVNGADRGLSTVQITTTFNSLSIDIMVHLQTMQL